MVTPAGTIFLFGFLSLLYSAYEDLKTTYVPEWLLIPASFVLGLNYYFRHGIYALAAVLLLGHLLYLLGFWASGDVFLFWLSAFLASPRLEELPLFTGVLFLAIFLFTCLYLLWKYRKDWEVILPAIFFIVLSLFVKEAVVLLFIILAMLTYKEYGTVVEMPTKDLTMDYWLEKPLKLPNGRIIPAGRPITEEEAEEIKKYYRKIRVRAGVPIGGGFPLAVLFWLIFSSFSPVQILSCLRGL